jgi:hypothetical protein
MWWIKMTRTKNYSLTDEHRAHLKPWAERWIANAMSTKAMDDADRSAMRVAVRGLYEAAGLTPPPDHRIVFVPSPLVLRFAGGFAAWVWHTRKYGADATALATKRATDRAITDAAYDATDRATYQATAQATYQATDDATYQATDQSTAQATDDATDEAIAQAIAQATARATDRATADATDEAAADAAYRAIDDATDQATYQATAQVTADATSRATDQATYQATGATDDDCWYYGVGNMSRVARCFGDPVPMMHCAKLAYRMWSGGNQWSGWVAFLSFFRHVARLPIDYSKWQHYEAAAIHGGPRIMHAEFCIISDRPEVLTVDGENRPHNDSGPFCRWRDGFSLYALHGVRVPRWLVETRAEDIDPKRVLSIDNAEVRAAFIRKVGIERVLSHLPHAVLDTQGDYSLIEIFMSGYTPDRWRYLKMRNPSVGVWHLEGVAPDVATVAQAINFRAGREWKPIVLT